MKVLRHLIPACVFALAFVTCVRVGQPMGRAEKLAWKLVNAPPLASMSTPRINLLMLGHRGLYDDFATVWAVQFLAEQNLTKKASAEEVFDAVRSITRHQPRLEALYLVSCFVLALDFNRPEFCEAIALDGLKAFPLSWRIPMTQGFVAAFNMKDHMKAAAFLELAASRPNSPPYVASLAKKFAAKGYASGNDLNETLDMLKEVPGGTRIIEILRQRVNAMEMPASPAENAATPGEPGLQEAPTSGGSP